MSTVADHQRQSGNRLERWEWQAAIAEVLALVVIFLIAFTGRSAFGDGVKTALTVLSVIAGAAGALAGLAIALRGLRLPAARIQRLALGTFMAFIGAYTIVHVLS
jgi:hypothetical protein